MGRSPALGGLLVAVGSLFGRGGAWIGLLVAALVAPTAALLLQLAGRRVSLAGLFATHPPVQARVERLVGARRR